MNQKLIKSLLEGLAVSIAAYYITNKKTDIQSIIMIGLVTTVTFMILDAYAPSVASSARIGTGFGIGYELVGGTEKPNAYCTNCGSSDNCIWDSDCKCRDKRPAYCMPYGLNESNICYCDEPLTGF